MRVATYRITCFVSIRRRAHGRRNLGWMDLLERVRLPCALGGDPFQVGAGCSHKLPEDVQWGMPWVPAVAVFPASGKTGDSISFQMSDSENRVVVSQPTHLPDSLRRSFPTSLPSTPPFVLLDGEHPDVGSLRVVARQIGGYEKVLGDRGESRHEGG